MESGMMKTIVMAAATAGLLALSPALAQAADA